MKKSLRGKRYLRSRTSVMAGRNKKYSHKMKMLEKAIKNSGMDLSTITIVFKDALENVAHYLKERISILMQDETIRRALDDVNGTVNQ